MCGAPSSAGWRHSATVARDLQAASRRLPSGIAPRVADYEDASALKSTPAGINDMVLTSSDASHGREAIPFGISGSIVVAGCRPMSDTKHLTPDEVLERYRGEVSAGTLRNWRAQRVGPPFIKIGKSVQYPVQGLGEWNKLVSPISVTLHGLEDEETRH